MGNILLLMQEGDTEYGFPAETQEWADHMYNAWAALKEAQSEIDRATDFA